MAKLNWLVHGDIRHLEMFRLKHTHLKTVHGDIRHLEMTECFIAIACNVHGDIRHLEIAIPTNDQK